MVTCPRCNEFSDENKGNPMNSISEMFNNMLKKWSRLRIGPRTLKIEPSFSIPHLKYLLYQFLSLHFSKK